MSELINGRTDKNTASLGSGFISRELDATAISDILIPAFTPFFNGIKNIRKCHKAVIKIAKSIAGDEAWLGLKRRSDNLLHDGIFRAFFNEETTAILLDSVLNPRVQYRDVSIAQCFSYWVEACNPIEIDANLSEVLRDSFKYIYLQLEYLRSAFTIKEFQVICKTTELIAAAYIASADTGAATTGTAPQGATPHGAAPHDTAATSANTDAKTAATSASTSTIASISASARASTTATSASASARASTAATSASASTIASASASTSASKRNAFLEYIKRLSSSSARYAKKRIIHYSDIVFPFIGRADEILELKRFCFSDRRLSWWSISGDCGVGKSFLASELCRRIIAERRTWYCIFIPNSFYENISHIGEELPLDRNLLAIIDNPGYYSDKLGAWLKQLIETETASRKIRILILDRKGLDGITEPAWYLMLKHMIDENVLRNLFYSVDFESLALKALDYSDYIDCVEGFGDDSSNIETAKLRVINQWTRCDPGLTHPLILQTIITAAANDADATEYGDLASLLDAVYEQLTNRVLLEIDAIGLDDPVYAAALLAIVFAAIVTGGAARDDYIRKICEIVGIGDDNQCFLRVRNYVRKLSSNAEEGAPDLLTGYFVLKTLNAFIDKGQTKSILSMVWQCGAFDVANFIRRVISDYYYSYALIDATVYLDVLYDIPVKASTGVVALYCELMVYLSVIQDMAGKLATAVRMEKLLSRSFRNKVVALRLAQVLVNITASQDDVGDIAATIARIAKLRSHGFTQDIDIALRLYKALYNMLLHQDASERKETVALMDELRNEGFEFDRDMALILAQSMFIMTAKQDEEGIKNTVERMEALRLQGFEKDKDITLELIKALLNLTTKQDGAGRETTVARMESLRDQGFGQDSEITLELVKAILNLTIKQDEAGILKSIIRIDEIRTNGYENDKEVALIYSQALLNLSTKQDRAGIAQTVEKLEALRKQGFEADRDIALVLSTALFNLTTKMDEDGIKKAVDRLESLRNNGFAYDRDITLRLAQSLFSLTTKHGQAARNDAAARIDSLRNQGFEQDRDVTLTLVKSLYNLSIEQDSDEAKDTITRIEEICNQGYSNDKEIKLLFAKSLFNLTSKLDVGGMAETVTRIETLRNQDLS